MNELIRLLNELTELHQELLTVSKHKTEAIKAGKTDELQRVLAEERKLSRKLERKESERMEAVNVWLEREGMNVSEPTVTAILEELDDEIGRNRLEGAAIELTNAITELKAQEKLNLALINQSMQFVQMSLDLLSPTLKNMNYSHTNSPAETPNRSIFDSKA
jgi:flagellar biosynthesis/type III secretory pathway chaperone